MKYPQLVQMPRDVEDWLEEQLKARGLDAVIYSRYIVNLLKQNYWNDPSEYLPSVSSHEKGSKKEHKGEYHDFDIWQPWDCESLKRLAVVRCLMSASNEKYDIENLVDELCAKLKDIESKGKGSSHYEIIPSQCVADPLPMDAALQCYAAFPQIDLYESNPVTMSPNSAWTRGLLHDSTYDDDNNKNTMEDYFSALFCGNAPDDFGFGFTRNNSGERQDGRKEKEEEEDRINFYNRQNLLDTECSERLYERNADIDKLIAKFDANVKDIWKSSGEPMTQTILSDSYAQYGNNFVWSFKQNEDDAKENVHEYKSSFSNWNKFSSPVLSNGISVTLSKWSAMDGQTSGTGLLNHNKESCFTEVVPKAKECEKNSSLNFSEANPNAPEEEDLLTSTKTHFRPIRMEEVQANQATMTYADGTTFAISNELEKVPFKRSESGAWYLDEDAKYQEFKESNRYTESESDLSSLEEFVPKFRVRQSNEKCCQTEDITEDQLVPSLNDTDCESDSYESEDEFYFPGDEELAQNIINSIDEEIIIKEKPKIKSDCNYNDIYLDAEGMEVLEITSFKKLGLGRCECGNEKEWEKKSFNRQGWSEIWSPQETCESCKANSEKVSTQDKYCRFREELTQDGEQLLSDLSCLQQLYSNSDWCDDDSTTASDFNDEEFPAGNGDGMMPRDGFFPEILDNYNNSKMDPSWKSLWAEEVKSSPEKILDEKIKIIIKGNDDKKFNEINERPFNADAVQKERKRRNSSSQKACNLYMEGQCRRPHCRFAHKDSAIPCPFYADASCLKGESCPLSHGLRRPLSL